jgi:hypothetical protein
MNSEFSEAKGKLFFPPQAFSEDEGLNLRRDRRYSRHLTAMQESSLWARAEDKKLHIYRFLWLRAFHRPIAVRLTINHIGEGQLIVRITDGEGGDDPGGLIHNETVFLPKESVDEFLAKLEALEFWSLPTIDPPSYGLDGANWVLEGLRDGVYHLVDRWSPREGEYSLSSDGWTFRLTREGEYRQATLKLVAFANITVENVY